MQQEGVIDEDDLIEAVNNGKGAVALDVFVGEPIQD